MLLSKTVMVKWNPANKKWYESKGYIFTKYKDEFEVKVEDLSKGSHSTIELLCDYCKEKVISREFKSYINILKKSTVHKDCCDDCKYLKIVESNLINYNVEYIVQRPETKNKILRTNRINYADENFVKEINDKRKVSSLERYGVECVLQSPIVKEKIKQTNLEKYGCEFVSQNELVKNKIKQTNLDRYGVENVFQNEDIKAKIREKNLEKYGFDYPRQNKEVKAKSITTNQERYGVDNYTQTEEYKIRSVAQSLEKWGTEYPVQNEEVKAKITNTMLKNWGVEHSMQNEELRNKAFATNIEKYGFKCCLQNEDIRAKAKITMFLSNTGPSSKQQDYVYEIIKKREKDALLNYPIGVCNLDIAFPDKMIYIEWDGSGHDLSVKLGGMLQEKFDIKQRKRDYYFKSIGWNRIRIISRKDLVPTENKILEILDYAESTFREGRSWITFDIDNYTVTNRNGIMPYDFGELKRVKTEQVLSNK